MFRNIAGRAAILPLALRCWLVLLALPGVFANAYAAEEFRYSLEFDAPPWVVDLLRNNLDIAKAKDFPRMDLAQLRFLYEKAPAQIGTLIATEGYYSPQITPSLTQGDDGWVARFAVDPGQATRVDQVALNFAGDILRQPRDTKPQIAELRKAWPLDRGQVFRQQQWEAAKRSFLRGLHVERYPTARISNSRAAVNPQTRLVDLSVEIDSGPPFSFEGLRIEGLQRYDESVVANLNPIAAGTPYSADALRDYQSLLLETGYFSSVAVTADFETERAPLAPIKVNVIEAPSKKLGFGAGYSTNTGARGEIAYRDFNVFDSGLQFSTNLRLEQKQQSLLTDLETPRNTQGYVYGLGLKAQRSDIQGEQLENLGLGVRRTAGNKRTERTWSVQYEIERQSVDGGLEDIRRALALNYAVNFRRFDDLLTPSRGWGLNLQLGGAADKVLSDQDFIRGYVKFIGIYPFAEKHSVIVRAEGGAVYADSRRGIPSIFLFRTGGDQTVRGYSFQSLGVREGNAIVGGRYLAIGSAEYIYWVKPDYGAAVFVDAGNAADTLPDLEPVLGYGVGARWRSPVGPLALDVAYGDDSNEVRLHFSLGFVF